MKIIRPFWPGGDYKSEAYPEDSVVIDNPPFSILAQIVDFYLQKGIRFFLFAPHLTLFNYLSRMSVTAVVCSASVAYENGAKVSTSFITNLKPSVAFLVDGDLKVAIEEANKKALPGKSLPKIFYPEEVTSAALLGKLAVKGIHLVVEHDRCIWTRRLDCGRAIFGSGVILSDSAAAELRAAELRVAELRAAELRAAHQFELSEREIGLKRKLR